MDNIKQEQSNLKRSLGLMMLTFYGLGTIVGAGIYVLIGEVAAVADNLFPYAFLAAGLIASFTALSYAELGSRFPYCAGEAVYINAAWHKKHLSTLVGCMIIITGIVSAATITNGFVGYLNQFISVDSILAMLGLVTLLWIITAWGIDLSARTIFIITVIEILGLLYIVWLALQINAPVLDEGLSQVTQVSKGVKLNGLVLGTFLAFYAFIGFEDMVNIIEEVKNPQKTFPLAIVLTMVLSVLIYGAVAFSVSKVLSPQELGLSDAPLVDFVLKAGGNPLFISLVSLLAVINGALVQIIMGSRVLYGMSNNGMVPKLLGRVNDFTRTPIVATTLVCSLVFIFAISLPLVQLAQLTSLVMLSVFVIVNLALISIKSEAIQKYNGLTLPLWVPICGGLSAFVLLVWQIYLFME